MPKPNIVSRIPFILFIFFNGLILGAILFYELKHRTCQNSQGVIGSALPETITTRERQCDRDLVGNIDAAFDVSNLVSALKCIQFEWQTGGEKIQAVADEIPQSDIPAILELLKKQVGTETVLEFDQLLLFRWAKNDPWAASAVIGQMSDGPERDAAITTVSTAWANVNYAQAFEWAKQLPTDSEQQNAFKNIAYEVARSDPVAAIGIAVNLSAGRSRDVLINYSAAQWASIAPEEAADWAKQITVQNLQETVMHTIAIAWADRDPVNAAKLALTLPAGKLQDDAIVGVVERWAQQDPQAVAAWVEQFPEGPLRTSAIENLVSQWNQSDSTAAQKWLCDHL